MNCRGLFASALTTTQQQQIKFPHICIPKAYTNLHFISSHLGYVVRKCYDFRTTVCCFTLCGFGKTAFDSYANSHQFDEICKMKQACMKTCACPRQNHANGGVLLHFFLVNCLHFERPLHRSRNTSASTFIAQATSQSTKGPIILTSIEAQSLLVHLVCIYLYIYID